MICYKDIQKLLMFYAYNLKLICLSILYSLYSTNQKTSSWILRNSITDIKCLNIAKISRNLPKFNMEQHVLYTYTRKCVEAKISFFWKIFAMCTQKTHGELNFCRVPAICRGLCLVAHGKMCVCRVPGLCRVPDVSPTVNFVAHGKGTFSGSESDWAVVWLPNLQQYVAIFIHWAASPRAAPVGAWPCTNGLHPGAGPQHSFFLKK